MRVGSKQHEGSAEKQATKSTKIPLSLKMLLECYERESSRIDECEFSEAVIIAKLIDIDLKNGKEILTFQDGAQIAAILTFQPSEGLELNRYYKFFCVMTKTSRQFRLSCFGFKEITDMSAWNDHTAQIILRHLERTKGFLER